MQQVHLLSGFLPQLAGLDLQITDLGGVRVGRGSRGSRGVQVVKMLRRKANLLSMGPGL